MPVFYMLHELFNTIGVNDDGEKIEHGKRNSKLFLLGIFIWVVIFVLFMNLKLGYFGQVGIWVDSIFYGLIVLFMADALVMAYTYKSYFNREISWEIDSPDNSEVMFNYDEAKHKYIKKTSDSEASSKTL